MGGKDRSVFLEHISRGRMLHAEPSTKGVWNALIGGEPSAVYDMRRFRYALLAQIRRDCMSFTHLG